jgi:hypothetical protein
VNTLSQPHDFNQHLFGDQATILEYRKIFPSCVNPS